MSSCHFSKKKSGFFQSLNHTSSEITLLYFLAETLYAIDKRRPSKLLWVAPIKINQIPYVIFQTTSQFFFKHCITLQCAMIQNSSEIFWLSILYLRKKKFLKVQILRFSSAPVKFTKFLMSLMKPHFIFPSKLASTFSMIIQYNDLLCTFLPQKL